MTKSVYLVGGAGTGKSTFMGQLLERQRYAMGPLVDLHAIPNARGTVVTLRGHELTNGGLYLGCMRDEYPGTDGLDRASSITGEAWLEAGDLPGFIVSEGATLATRRFMTALHQHTDLLLVHLYADDFVKELRFLQRGSNQDPGFLKNTVTRSANLVAEMAKAGAKVWEVDSSDPEQWAEALDVCRDHLSH